MASASAQTVVYAVNTDSAASAIPWQNTQSSIFARNTALSDVFKQFGSQQNIKVIVAPDVTGTVNGQFENISPMEFLALMTSTYNLTWFYSDRLLYIYPASDIKTDIITLSFANPAHVESVISEMKLLSPDGRVLRVGTTSMLKISGPPEYRRIVTQVISTLDVEKQFNQQGETVVEVFPLNYAWAYDINLASTTGGNTVIEGVATTLRKLISPQASGNIGANFSASGQPTAMVGALSDPATGQAVASAPNVGGLPAIQGNAAANSAQNSASAPTAGKTNGSQEAGVANTSKAEIVADVRSNSVIIRDTRGNMSFYARAISKLDRPARIIEISAAIVDLELGRSQAIGLNAVKISGTSSNGSEISVGGVADPASLSGTSDVTSPPNVTGSATLTSGIFGTTTISAAINFLEQKNKAKMLSKPTVLTLDNFAATINRQETFYVNSTGQYVSNLFNVTSGLSLQVIPHITYVGTKEQVYLQVMIEDGALTQESTVSGLPTVQQSTLTTQAMVKKDQSLLIGGLYIKLNQSAVSGYPWLRKIPVLGYLFSVKGTNYNVVERLFLITPRIIELDQQNLGDYREYFKPSPLVEKALESEADAREQELIKNARRAIPVSPAPSNPVPVVPSPAKQ